MKVKLHFVDPAQAKERTAVVEDTDMTFVRNFLTVFSNEPELLTMARKDWRNGVPFRCVSGSQTLTITAVQ